MTTGADSIVKDYLFIAVLLCFLIYRLPVRTQLVGSEPLRMSIIEYQQREPYILNSILESGVRLLDIKLELESSLLSKSSDLVAHIRFDSFGNVPTLINLNYAIVDTNGVEVYRELGDVTVETEKSLTKEFKKLNLKKGQYSLILTTLYNTDVKDEFKQDFTVKGMSGIEIMSWTILVLGIIGIGGSLIYKLFKLRSGKIYDKE